MSGRQVRLWEFARQNGEITTADAAAVFFGNYRDPRRLATRNLSRLAELGILRRTSKGRYATAQVQFLRDDPAPAFCPADLELWGVGRA